MGNRAASCFYAEFASHVYGHIDPVKSETMLNSSSWFMQKSGTGLHLTLASHRIGELLSAALAASRRKSHVEQFMHLHCEKMVTGEREKEKVM